LKDGTVLEGFLSGVKDNKVVVYHYDYNKLITLKIKLELIFSGGVKFYGRIASICDTSITVVINQNKQEFERMFRREDLKFLKTGNLSRFLKIKYLAKTRIQSCEFISSKLVIDFIKYWIGKNDKIILHLHNGQEKTGIVKALLPDRIILQNKRNKIFSKWSMIKRIDLIQKHTNIGIAFLLVIIFLFYIRLFTSTQALTE